MKKFLPMILSTMMLLSTFFAGPVSTVSAEESENGARILKFDTMVGIPAGLTGAQSVTPLRGISGGGLPWTLRSASGELKASGRLEIQVRGLVLAAGANAGSNPLQTFRATVSCLGSDGTPQNVQTEEFSATTGPASSGGGNAKIKTTVDLPQPCIAPIIFITSAGGNWLAVTGN